MLPFNLLTLTGRFRLGLPTFKLISGQIERILIRLTPVVNVIKVFTVVSYDFSKFAKVFVPGMPF